MVSCYLAQERPAQEEGADGLRALLSFLREVMEEDAESRGEQGHSANSATSASIGKSGSIASFASLLDVPRAAFCQEPLLVFATGQVKCDHVSQGLEGWRNGHGRGRE